LLVNPDPPIVFLYKIRYTDFGVELISQPEGETILRITPLGIDHLLVSIREQSHSKHRHFQIDSNKWFAALLAVLSLPLMLKKLTSYE